MNTDITSPRFLFQPNDSEEQDTSLVYLTDESNLKNIVSNLCKKLHHPIALIDYNAIMNKKTNKKLESMVEMYPMRRSCSILRKCAGDAYCEQCDRYHARCMDIDTDSIERRIQENIKDIPDFFYTEYLERCPKVLKGFNRPVIEYHCPMLGYRELIFPLFYEDKQFGNRLFGVFFAGQIMVYDENDEVINEAISSSFFKKNRLDKLFQPFVDGYNEQGDDIKKIDYEYIRKLIEDSDKEARSYDNILGFKQSWKKDSDYYSKNFKTIKDYHIFIGDICDEIARTEESISDAYEKRRKSFFIKSIEQISEKNFFEIYRNVHSCNEDNLPEKRKRELNVSWSALKSFAKEIKKKFAFIETISVFGDKQGISIVNSSKKEIAFSVPILRVQKQGWLDFSIHRNEETNGYDNSIDKPNIISGLSENLSRDNIILIRCHDIAMLIQVKKLDVNKNLYYSITEAIGKELVRINSVIALCSANLTKEKYLLTLRMYRHENAHISTRLMGHLNRYFDNSGQRFLNANDDKRFYIYNDMKNIVQLIANIADNIGFVTGTGIAADDPQKDTALFDVVDMLYKWQSMFNDELEGRNLEIIVYRGGHDLSMRYKSEDSPFINELIRKKIHRSGRFATAPREIMVNARLFELIVYNLVDNAVKYAYRGTNIYLIWSRSESKCELSVTSFGPSMPEKDVDVYGLYVRGNDERILSGDGLGLYVVKKIAEKLDFEIRDECERISDYNVPLISWYKKTDFSTIKGYTKIEDSKLYLNSDVPLLIVNRYEPTEIKIKVLGTC